MNQPTPEGPSPDQPPVVPPPPPLRFRTVRRAATIFGGLIVLYLLYLAFWPAPIDPVPWTPPPSHTNRGPLAPNEKLQKAELIAVGEVDGPEDIDFDAQGRLVTGTADGSIKLIDQQDGKTTVSTLVNTGGRPIGLAYAPDGNLIVADAKKGLLSVTPEGQITTLVTTAGDVPLGFTDDVTVASDGKIYFSDASSKFGPDEYLLDMLEGRPHGRLLCYDPVTKETTVLIDGLCFANGVALSEKEDFVVVNETYRFCAHRHWLSGPNAGTSEVFVNNLPGYPDNITSNGKGRFWLALFTVRNPTADWLAPHPFYKQALSKLPRFAWPKPQPVGMVIEISDTGAIAGSLQDLTGENLSEVTSAREHDGYLYLGSLHNDRIGKYKLP